MYCRYSGYKDLMMNSKMLLKDVKETLTGGHDILFKIRTSVPGVKPWVIAKVVSRKRIPVAAIQSLFQIQIQLFNAQLRLIAIPRFPIKLSFLYKYHKLVDPVREYGNFNVHSTNNNDGNQEKFLTDFRHTCFNEFIVPIPGPCLFNFWRE